MFDLNFQEKGSLLLHTRKFLLYPPYWEDSTNKITHTLTWNSVKFTELNKAIVPESKGLYCFIVCPNVENFVNCNYLFYIGKTNRTLKKRFEEYVNEQKGNGKTRGKVFEMLNLYKEYLFFNYTEIDDPLLVDSYEESLLNTFVPFINTSIPNAVIKPELARIYEH